MIALSISLGKHENTIADCTSCNLYERNMTDIGPDNITYGACENNKITILSAVNSLKKASIREKKELQLLLCRHRLILKIVNDCLPWIWLSLH